MWILIVLNGDDNDGSVIKIIGYIKTSHCLCNKCGSLFHITVQRPVRYSSVLFLGRIFIVQDEVRLFYIFSPFSSLAGNYNGAGKFM